jgi:hypothetical protein
MDTYQALLEADPLRERELPTLVVNGEPYFVDSLLRELRSVVNPLDRIAFSSL